MKFGTYQILEFLHHTECARGTYTHDFFMNTYTEEKTCLTDNCKFPTQELMVPRISILPIMFSKVGDFWLQILHFLTKIF